MIPTPGHLVSTPLAAFASLTFALAPAAQTVTVGPPNSGAMFTSISAGIAAAPPGGIVLVASGVYSSTTTLVVDKPLTLLGDGSGSTHFIANALGPFDLPLPLLIEDLPAGKSVLIAGIQVSSQGVLGGGATVVVEHCQGTVVLADVVGSSFVFQQAIPAVAQVRDSASVTLDGCRFLAVGVGAGIEPMAGLHVERSLVHVNACHVAGASPSNGTWAGSPFDGAPGIVAVDATLRIARSRVLGGTGNPPNPFVEPTIATAGAAAVAANGSQILVRGGPGNELHGGQGGAATANGVTVSATGGAAIHLDATSLGATTPDVVAIAGRDGNLQANTPAIDGPGAFAHLAFPLATIAVTAPLVFPGGSAELALDGEPLAACLPLLALEATTGFSLPGVFGLFTVGPAGIVTLPVAVLDAVGAGTASLPVPPSPSLAGTVVHAQSLSFGPGSWISVSSPTSFAVR